MMIALHPTYTLRIEYQDKRPEPQMMVGPNMGHVGQSMVNWAHKFYAQSGKTGCDDILALVKKALSDAGLSEARVTLEKFEHRS